MAGSFLCVLLQLLYISWMSDRRSIERMMAQRRTSSYTKYRQQGTLRGFDQTTNLILSGAKERLFSLESGMEELSLGLYVLRGDNIGLVGLLDSERDSAIDWPQVLADPIPPIRNTLMS